ncbi:hypothetical protein [Anaerofustis butyriciformans]|uniref:hypothetical protein n=1 Tax=Anaerofustis butyriciformans TaxID=3108533 RepID=UPI002E303212|nr:hypothetical protein [Anaerofustis sp. HA2171]
MEFEYLDEESEELLKELIEDKDLFLKRMSGIALENLIDKGFVSGENSTYTIDREPHYDNLKIKQKGYTYFEMKEKYEKEKRKEFIFELIKILPKFLSSIILKIFFK